MGPILNYFKRYFYETNKLVLILISLLAATLIFFNYFYGVDQWISKKRSFTFSVISRYVIFLIAFGLPYLLYVLIAKRKYFSHRAFNIVLLLAPLIFSLKIALNISFHFSDDYAINSYWNHVFYWPVLLCIVAFFLFALWKIFDSNQPFYGTTTKNINWKPYWLMLLIMLPLVAAASTQPDFLAMYPKLKLIAGSSEEINWWQKILFELSYGSDFIGIELFFRGFLILAFVKWAGKDAILPMACFYCAIHFGKPLAECISSYFGGIVLGIVVYNTKSIWGGLMVHLGIAWLMELGGNIGNLLSP